MTKELVLSFAYLSSRRSCNSLSSQLTYYTSL
uniref:Uncharacterized protein n=1 Tax=Rhizophora mucronata TaxID=61149 RepID=A0A2P2QTS7_RHIMU